MVRKKKVERKNINLQQFMDDMMLLSSQIKNPNLKKPTSFNYGDLTVTNYLLWLILAELKILNSEGV